MTNAYETTHVSSVERQEYAGCVGRMYTGRHTVYDSDGHTIDDEQHYAEDIRTVVQANVSNIAVRSTDEHTGGASTQADDQHVFPHTDCALLHSDSEDELPDSLRHNERGTVPTTPAAVTCFQWGDVGPTEGVNTELDRAVINIDRLIREAHSDTDTVSNISQERSNRMSKGGYEGFKGGKGNTSAEEVDDSTRNSKFPQDPRKGVQGRMCNPQLQEPEELTQGASSKSDSDEVPDLLRMDELGNVIEIVMSARERNEYKEAKGERCSSSTDEDGYSFYRPTTSRSARPTSHTPSTLLFPGTGMTDTVADFERWASTQTETDDAEWRNSPQGGAYDWLTTNPGDSGGAHKHVEAVQDQIAVDPYREVALGPWRRYAADARTRLLTHRVTLQDRGGNLQGVHGCTPCMHRGHMGNMQQPLECEHCNGVGYINTTATPCPYCRPTQTDADDDSADVQGVNEMEIVHALINSVHESDSEMSDSTVFTVDTEEGNHSYYVDLREAIEPPAHMLEQHRAVHRAYRQLHGPTHHHTRQFTEGRNILHAKIRGRAHAEFKPDIAIINDSRKSKGQNVTYSSADDFELEQKLSDTSKRARAVQTELRDLLDEIEGRRVKARGEPAGDRENNSSTSYSSSTTPSNHQHTRAEGKGPAPTREKCASRKSTGVGLSPSKAKALKKRKQTGIMAPLYKHQDEASD
ncbi:hypothetical protein B484DRAFT_472262, partial [Ochromonadaceae sp. CCMP2298]